jgi:hypothetical protein
VQITGGRPDDVQERRNSTTAKIIVGREEIDRFGDSTLGDVLKRLPGVTIQGGRGGAARSACAASAAATPRSCSMASGAARLLARFADAGPDRADRDPACADGRDRRARDRRHDQHHHARRLHAAASTTCA